jgi:hypothetical protein
MECKSLKKKKEKTCQTTAVDKILSCVKINMFLESSTTYYVCSSELVITYVFIQILVRYVQY